VSLLQEALLEAKAEWQGLKDARQIKEDSTVETREVMTSKTPKAEGKIGEQAYIHGVKARDEEKKDFTKNSKTWPQVISNSAHMEKETHN
jgi:hypothetical protein